MKLVQLYRLWVAKERKLKRVHNLAWLLRFSMASLAWSGHRQVAYESNP